MGNFLTDVGRRIIVNRLSNSPLPSSPTPGWTVPAYIAWGTGGPNSPATDAARTDTAMFTERSEARVAGTVSVVTTTSAGDTYQCVGTMTLASGTNIQIIEAGIFDASTSGNMFIHSYFGAGQYITLNTGDQITYTFKLQFT